MQTLIYILTEEYNEYYQYGEYFIAWFRSKPTIEEIKTAIATNSEFHIDDTVAKHILNKGGRIKNEGTWWNLKQVPSSNFPQKTLIQLSDKNFTP